MTALASTDLARACIPLTGASADYDPLLDFLGDASIVLLGEATHGTLEFYRERARITRRLIEERDFNAVCIEGDWPDAYRVHRYVLECGDDDDANQALAGFQRFPTWMWRNEDVLEFVEWLRGHNSAREEPGRTGFYGLDLYSLFRSMSAVIGYLERTDPDAAAIARRRYACFDHATKDEQAYGLRTTLDRQSCEHEVVEQLLDLLRSAPGYLRRDGRTAEDDLFYAEQNARVVVNAERYYRLMYRGGANTWNLRDRHMADTVDVLMDHLAKQGRLPKIVVWAHNSHVGDARATEMGDRGELNIGQLMRERHGDDVRIIGFSTYSGTVTAASDWGAMPERKTVRPGMPGSHERLFHDLGVPAFLLTFRDAAPTQALAEPHLQRAIGVIYRPETERWSHYSNARIPHQYDAVIHIDHTEAVHPLEKTPAWIEGEVPETYPTAL